jgi:hypothetical protein
MLVKRRNISTICKCFFYHSNNFERHNQDEFAKIHIYKHQKTYKYAAVVTQQLSFRNVDGSNNLVVAFSVTHVLKKYKFEFINNSMNAEVIKRLGTQSASIRSLQFISLNKISSEKALVSERKIRLSEIYKPLCSLVL